MADYKYETEDQEWVRKYPETIFNQNSPLQEEFQNYLDGGGEVDPWKTETEILDESKALKKEELIISYNIEEQESTIVAGSYEYHSNNDHLREVLTERILAIMNSETTMVVFDVDNVPHSFDISVVESVLQDIRAVTNIRRDKLKTLFGQLNDATTVAEVDLIAW